MQPRRLTRLRAALAVLSFLAPAAALAQGPPPTAPVEPIAERLYADARPRLLQIRTLVATAGQQASIGSGFLVGDDGLTVTNYHVVAQAVLEPGAYRLEYTAADGSHGPLKIMAIDVANDLAVVKSGVASPNFFTFDDRALRGTVPQGERLYSMGNPLDLGFAIVEGTYNGLVERSYNDRIHFSGAINPGMSGGPAVARDGRVVGINVSKRLGNDLVSFLVPAAKAVTLIQHAVDPPPALSRAEVARQLTQRQRELYEALERQGFRRDAFGHYSAMESDAPWFTCWARTNSEQVPKPRAIVSTTSCTSNSQLFVSDDLVTGTVMITHSYVTSIDLNTFQFAAFLSRQYNQSPLGALNRKRFTPQKCHEGFAEATSSPGAAPLHLVWCANAYRDFDQLYDVSLAAVTENSSSQALISQMNLRAVPYAQALALGKTFLDGIRWSE